MSATQPDVSDSATLPARWWWGFVPFLLVSLVHIVALTLNADEIAAPTKLVLMPALIIAVLWGGRGSTWGVSYTLLFAALALSWLGDGAGFFFPDAPTLPLMLLFFGLAHLCYIWLFAKRLAVRRFPRWSAIYLLWWIVTLAILSPALLAQPGGGAWVAALGAYGVVLGATAATASRCNPVIATGAAFFLASDTLLAFLLFTPDAMPAWSDPLVMLTYCTGQGLIAAGVIIADRALTPRSL
ncbi:lysoplasmalogenase family protein [Microbacterium sp. R86528]|uniref:lysoplasmalogenase family protein n=1 Tax=Microbacterium sp. R86528 TaxID=3093864 RepID=UPI0037C67599